MFVNIIFNHSTISYLLKRIFFLTFKHAIYAFSITTAAPWPPPIHKVANPY